MGTKYLITEPSEPGWWPKNKSTVFAVAGLVVGLYFGGGCGQDAHTEQPEAPRPSTSTSPSTSPSGSPR